MIESIITYQYETHNAETNTIYMNASNVLSGIFASVMTYLRKTSGQSLKSASSERLALMNVHTAGIGNHEDFRKHLIALFPEIAFIDWQYCTPIVNMMSANRLFFNEARCGVTTWKMIQRAEEPRGQKRKADDVAVKKIAVKERLSDYGLGPMAIPFMKGITLKPERRSGLLKCLGPLTLAILLYNADLYRDKLMRALEDSLSHLPSAKDIVKAIAACTTRPELTTIISTLNRVLTLTYDRSHNKMHFPIATFMLKGPGYQWERFDFSGAGGYLFYNQLSGYNIDIRSESTNHDHIAQAIFHAIFGSYLEDLSILAKITNQPQWATRNELNAVYVGKKETGVVSFNVWVKFTLFAKLKSANITKFGAGQMVQVSSLPVFSGYRARKISTKANEFITTGQVQVVSLASSYSVNITLENFIRSCLSDATKMAAKVGTTEWYKKIVVREGKATYDEIHTDAVVETGRYFFSTNDN